MAQPDPVEELAHLLAGFHISRRLANEAGVMESNSPTPTTDSKKKGFSYSHSSCPADAQCCVFWGPPRLDYSEYVFLLEAEKEILTSQRARTELPWRVAVMDIMLEVKLLDQGVRWVNRTETPSWGTCGVDGVAGCDEEDKFLSGLRDELNIDIQEVMREMSEDINRRHGKSKKKFRKLTGKIEHVAYQKQNEAKRKLAKG